eukprot:COSAG06_NODE_1042_length_10980_cov_31.644150_4_plen_52_part_00
MYSTNCTSTSTTSSSCALRVHRRDDIVMSPGGALGENLLINTPSVGKPPKK